MFTLEDELVSCGFSKREIDKIYAFYYIVKSRINRRFEKILDLCAGNGLAGFLFNYYGFAERSIMVDIKKPRKASKIEKLSEKYELRCNYLKADINNLKFLEFENDVFIAAVHPCGELSDIIMKKAIKSGLPFAIMTCCHESQPYSYNLQNPPDPRLMMYGENADYFDLVRKIYAEEHGFKCDLLEIPRKITPKNHVLIGIPK